MTRPLKTTTVGALDPDAFQVPDWYKTLSIAGTAIGAYHGYARNESLGWALVWALAGSIAPIVVIPVAFAQGVGKRA